MDDETKRGQQSLKPLFPNLNDEELKAVEDVFYGYLQIAWRIFKRIETEEAQKAQEKRDEPEFAPLYHRSRWAFHLSAFLPSEGL